MTTKEKKEEFLEKLQKLCDEYNASISTGCGCCDAGLYIDDKDFSLNIKSKKD